MISAARSGSSRRSSLQQVAQRPAVDELHHDVGHRQAAHHVLAGVVDGDDRRVVQRGRGLGLTPEPGLEGLVAGQVVTKRLNPDDAVETDVAGPEHLGHAATPDDAVEFVAAAEQPGLSHVSHLRYRPAIGGCDQHRRLRAAALRPACWLSSPRAPVTQLAGVRSGCSS